MERQNPMYYQVCKRHSRLKYALKWAEIEYSPALIGRKGEYETSEVRGDVVVCDSA